MLVEGTYGCKVREKQMGERKKESGEKVKVAKCIAFPFFFLLSHISLCRISIMFKHLCRYVYTVDAAAACF